MKTHVLAGCGSFMAGLSTICKEMGNHVIAYDQLFQAPMHTQLTNHAIPCVEGYDHLAIAPNDEVIVGNSIRRGLPVLEHLMQQDHPLHSGASWLRKNLLRHRKTVAISGTHGKTTTTALTAWVLDALGHCPGYLLGGIPVNMPSSARLGQAPYFVIEADEYDTACFDKRPKFFHYPAHALIINNLEFDHADIYSDLDAIKQQIKHYLATLKPGTHVIYPAQCPHISELVKNAPWLSATATHAHQASGPWRLKPLQTNWSQFIIYDSDQNPHHVTWPLICKHNAENALNVMATMHALGYEPATVAQHMHTFQGVQRRMQSIPCPNQVHTIWDDFAHHPTALKNVLSTLKQQQPSKRLVVYLQLSNFTQREGVMWQDVLHSTEIADVIFLQILPGGFPYDAFASTHPKPVILCRDDQLRADFIAPHLQPGDQIVSCSSRSCSRFHQAVIASVHAHHA